MNVGHSQPARAPGCVLPPPKRPARLCGTQAMNGKWHCVDIYACWYVCAPGCMPLPPERPA
eukprot:1161692-Pelagomonas_calceolata.AAC.3